MGGRLSQAIFRISRATHGETEPTGPGDSVLEPEDVELCVGPPIFCYAWKSNLGSKTIKTYRCSTDELYHLPLVNTLKNDIFESIRLSVAVKAGCKSKFFQLLELSDNGRNCLIAIPTYYEGSVMIKEVNLYKALSMTSYHKYSVIALDDF